MERRFVRQVEGRLIAGVCAGLARYFVVPTVLVRLTFLALAATYGVGLLLYLTLWLRMPLKPAEEAAGPEPAIAERAYQAALERRRNLLGVILFLLGAGLALLNLFVFGLPLFYWPLLLALGGLALFFRRGTRLRST